MGYCQGILMAHQPDEQEKRLLQNVYSGLPVIFTTKTRINTQFLRDQILEIADAATDDSGRHRSCLRWVIHNAVFVEKLDLSDGRRCCGAPLPALEFHTCEFQRGFCADGAHIDRLRFNNCTFTCSDIPDDPGNNFISLRNCRINSELRLENLRPLGRAGDKPRDGRLLWVDGFAMSVGTNIAIHDTLLRGPTNQGSSDPEPRYALDLSTAQINCDLQLQPNVILEGGLKMRDARIGGTVWGQALRVTDGETPKSRDLILLRGELPRNAFRAQGATIRGSLLLDAITSEYKNPLQTIGGAGPLGPDPLRFWCEGSVDLRALHVEGELVFSGAYVGGTPNSDVNLYAARLSGGLVAAAVVPVATLERFDRPQKLVLEVECGICLDGCRISGDCYMELKTSYLSAGGVSVGGNLTLKGDTYSLQAAGLEVGRDTRLALKRTAECNLGGSNLRGKLDISETSFFEEISWSRRRVEEPGQLEWPSRWRVVKVRQHPLVCYPGFTLSEVSLFADSDSPLKIATFIHKRASQALFLTGDSSRLHALNQVVKLELPDEEAAGEYLRLFCAYTWGHEGPFVIIEHSSGLPTAFRDGLNVQPLTFLRRDDAGGAFVFDAFVRYGRSLLKAKFEVEPSGIVRMTDDEDVRLHDRPVVYDRDEIPEYDKPFRLTSSQVASDFLPRSGDSETRKSLESLLQDVPQWRKLMLETIPPVFFRRGNLSLRDADIGHMFVVSPMYWEIAGVRQRQLTCYQGFTLSEIMLVDDTELSQPRVRIASFIHKGNEQVVLLTGESRQFHNLNRAISLNIQDETTAREYLRLFAAYIWAENGAYSLIEETAALPERFRSGLVITPVTLAEGKPAEPDKPAFEGKERTPFKVFVFNAFVRYGLFLSRAKFEVRGDGFVTMIEDEFVKLGGEPVVYKEREVPEYNTPFRLARLEQTPDFVSESAASDIRVDPRRFTQEVPDWSERLVRGRLTAVNVDLRDATCGTLNDNAGRVWEGSPPVELEEFSYNVMFLPPGANVGTEMEARLRWLNGLPKWSRRRRIKYLIGRVLRVFWIVRGPGPAGDRPFRAQPYTQLTKAFQQRGDDDAAREVEVTKIRLAAYDRASSLRGRMAMLWWWFYGFSFRFGLSPFRAFVALVLLWSVGFIAIKLLDENDLLTANVGTFASAAIAEPKGEVVRIVPRAPKDTPAPKLPCREAIAPALYAAELLIPILNLHQESRCDIRGREPQDEGKTQLTFRQHPYHVFHWMVLPLTWEYLKALYIVFGSIVTSLALLTFSGIARRWER
jgi:hypothetical protein